MVFKAVILAAGSASRMQRNLERYVSNEEELSLIRKGEKMAKRFERFPFLDYQILSLLQSGLKRINLVLNPEDRFFTNHYQKNGKNLFPEVEISYSFQETQDGTAHAVLSAENFVNGERFIVLNGDNYYPVESIRMLTGSPEECSSMVAFDTLGFNKWTRQRIKSYAVIKTSQGKLFRILEKVSNPEKYATEDLLYTINDERVGVKNCILTSMNLWCFTPDIIEACRDVERHEPRKADKEGEFELPDAVQLLIERGRGILVFYACEDILDLTKANDIEIVGRRIRKNLKDKIAELGRRYMPLS